MAREITCPQCTSSWMMEDSGATGEFICPTCMHRIDLSGTVSRPEVAPAAPTQESAADPSGTLVAARPAAATAAVATGEQVVCPRCSLHFYPHGRHAAQPAERRHTVLVVEDQAYFREIAADALGDQFEVRTADCTGDARKLLATGGIDLLILDLTLDGGDEGETLLRELVPKPCPILIFTAQDESELYGERWEELSRLGADDLVMKGMNVSESLRRKVRGLLGEPPDDEEGVG